MRPLLVVMNPRNIEECVSSYRRLPLDKAWMTGYSEPDLPIAQLVEDTDYTHYLVVSDDAVVPVGALAPILEALDDGHPVVTGYSNLDATDMRVNLTKSPFKIRDVSLHQDYDFWHLSEVIAYPFDLVPTFFAGMCMTGMSRDLWREFPFKCVKPHPDARERERERRLKEGDGLGARTPMLPSDWYLCVRLDNVGIPIVACQQSFVWHVKERLNQTDTEDRKRLLLGIVPQEVRMEIW